MSLNYFELNLVTKVIYVRNWLHYVEIQKRQAHALLVLLLSICSFRNYKNYVYEERAYILSTESLSCQVSQGLMYAEVGPQIQPVTVMPPAIDSIVRYTSLIHDQSRAKDLTGIIYFG